MDGLDATTVIKELNYLVPNVNGKDIALICYEKSSDFCHRHLVAEWLNRMDLSVRSGEMKYEVVFTKNCLDVGLLVEKDGTKPKKILSRNSTYGLGLCYGGVEKVKWIHTGVFLSKDEWNKITLDKPTDQILYELNIKKLFTKI